MSIAALGAQIVALTLAPLTVVQPADAAGLVLLLLLGGPMLGERVGGRELGAVAAIVVGIVAIVAAGPSRSVDHAGTAGLVEGLLVVGALAAVPYAVRGWAGTDGLGVVFGAGFAFAAAAFSVKLVADSLASQAWLTLGVVGGVAAAAAIAGTISEQTALRARESDAGGAGHLCH